jgi:hypothetical protein
MYDLGGLFARKGDHQESCCTCTTTLGCCMLRHVGKHCRNMGRGSIGVLHTRMYCIVYQWMAKSIEHTLPTTQGFVSNAARKRENKCIRIHCSAVQCHCYQGNGGPLSIPAKLLLSRSILYKLKPSGHRLTIRLSRTTERKGRESKAGDGLAYSCTIC